MLQPRVKCPSCHAFLILPPKPAEGYVVRCGSCRSRLRIKSLATLTEDQVMGWLNPPSVVESEEANLPEHPPRAKLRTDQTQTRISGQTAEMPAMSEQDYFRMVQLKSDGVLFEFSAGLLRQEAFRCSMPRRCMHCGTQVHLQAHVIIYSSHLQSSVSMEQEHAAEKLTLSDDEVTTLTGVALLSRLPVVPNVPEPGNQPMPYWLCDMCSAAGDISGQIQVNTQTGAGWCRLKIRSPWRAVEFLDAIPFVLPAEKQELRKFIEARTENPWDTLSLAVQHRLEQWYRPEINGAFLAYIPDRDHTRTEDGMSGLLVSSKRLTHHTPVRHHEIGQDLPLNLRLSTYQGRGLRLGLTCATCKIQMAVDKFGVDQLRKALSKAKFKAIWE